MSGGGLNRRSLLKAGGAGAGVGLGALALAPGAGRAQPAAAAPGAALAPTPPMGWNSWNSFATTITEGQALETARIMADRLLPFGYDVFTVDIQWYEPEASSYTYNSKPQPTMDQWGRPQPAPNRFPSAADGSGFTALAQQVHALGLRFGIHVMRGIPRAAVEQNLPVIGADGVRAADIADTSSICSWNPDMYGVDMTKPGAQAWYDGTFRQYAEWGVDFVKMDDMSRPYDAHAPEIEAAHAAIGHSGRPIVLSLSPGETPVHRGDHVRQHAQMWRISDDFWDEWPQLLAQFTRLENWQPWTGPGSWPDADMLPLGRLALGDRDTNFTPDEQRTLMTLWAIARSPLIMGGDLRHLDDATLALLTNREVIALNQASRDNRPHFLLDGLRVWTARAADGAGAYLALFNTGDEARAFAIDLAAVGLAGATGGRELWTGAAMNPAGGKVETTIPSHGAVLLRLS